MATVTWNVSKDARIADNGSNLGAGASDFNPTGLYGGFLYRTLLGFSYSFSGMVSITSAVLWMKSSTQNYVAFGSDPDMTVRRLSSSWSEGSSVGLSGSNAVHWGNQPGVTGSTATGDMTTSESTWDSITITYTTNTAPNAPTSPTPTGDTVVSGLTPTFSATFSDPDAGDHMANAQVIVYADDGTTVIWDSGSFAAAGASFSKAYAGSALTGNTFYKWKGRTADDDGAWGAYTA